MRCWCLALLACLGLTGCESSSPPPPPTDPVEAGVVVPTGMPNDRWFHENVLKSKVPVLIDFTADWCPPCQEMKPELKKIEETYGKRLVVAPVNVDDHEYLSAFFHVTGIPRLMLIQDGVIQADEVGGRDYRSIVNLIEPTVGAP